MVLEDFLISLPLYQNIDSTISDGIKNRQNTTMILQPPKGHFMDKIEHISDPKLIQQYVEFHLSIVINMFHFLIINQQPFRIVIHDPSRKYKNDFDESIYTDDYVILDIANWTLEVSSIDDKLPYLYTTVVFGETPVDITIDALDIARIFMLTNLTSPLYSRPFVPPIIASSEPLTAAVAVDPIHANAELYASQHSDAIQHSMSCLTLLKLGDQS